MAWPHWQQSLAIGPFVCVHMGGARTLTASGWWVGVCGRHCRDRLSLFHDVISGRSTSVCHSSVRVEGFYASCFEWALGTALMVY